ncbi:hypothetical protein MXB_1873 [Myxobolus squamalis]|nr:hypothetical protein MXB_1873 [Myxobolus squamalis]
MQVLMIVREVGASTLSGKITPGYRVIPGSDPTWQTLAPLKLFMTLKSKAIQEFTLGDTCLYSRTFDKKNIPAFSNIRISLIKNIKSTHDTNYCVYRGGHIFYGRKF